MSCTHGAPHMIHDTGARCPWCLHTIATGVGLPGLPVAAAGVEARHFPTGSTPAANPAPEVSGEREQPGGFLPAAPTSGAAQTPTQGSPADPLLTEGDEAPGALVGTNTQQRAHDGFDGPAGQDRGSDGGKGMPAIRRRWGQVPDPMPPQPTARNTDPPAAWNAAADAKSAAARNRIRCIIAHANAGDAGLTGDELEAATGVPYETIGPRRPWLEDNGFVVQSGTRPNVGGRLVGVYVITPEGRRMVADLRAAGWADDGTRIEVAA